MAVVDDGVPDGDGRVDRGAAVTNDKGIGFGTGTIGRRPCGEPRLFLDGESGRNIRHHVQGKASAIVKGLTAGGRGPRAIDRSERLNGACGGIEHGREPLIVAGGNSVAGSAGKITGNRRGSVIGRIPLVTRTVWQRRRGAAGVAVHFITRVGVGKIGVIAVGTGDINDPGGQNLAWAEVFIFRRDDIGA